MPLAISGEVHRAAVGVAEVQVRTAVGAVAGADPRLGAVQVRPAVGVVLAIVVWDFCVASSTGTMPVMVARADRMAGTWPIIRPALEAGAEAMVVPMDRTVVPMVVPMVGQSSLPLRSTVRL